MLFTKEHYELMAQFERDFSHHCLERETKDIWKIGAIYQNGQTNELFLAYRMGHGYAMCANRLAA